MGAVMAPACADTIYRHLSNTKTSVNDYDLILSGDLGIYGKDILREYMKTEYGISLNNYDDTATMIYDIDTQPVYAGGSGPACAPLVVYGYILKKNEKERNKKDIISCNRSFNVDYNGK